MNDSSILTTARRYLFADLSVIPIRADGSKAPTIKWEAYQGRRMTDAEAALHFRNGLGVAIVGGAVSKGLEVLDFDDSSLFGPWRDHVEAEAPGLVERLVLVDTPRPGVHVFYRCSTVDGNLKLAQRPDGVDSKTRRPAVKVMIETRGEGGYVVAPGSPPACHPSGKPYTLAAGSLEKVPEITEAEREVLLRCARSFNRVAGHVIDGGGAKAKRDGSVNGTRPGDEYNRRTTWAEILKPAGWQHVKDRTDGASEWKRPGKDAEGISATVGYCKSGDGGDLLHVFSSNASPFEAGGTYSKFAAYAMLNHSSDFTAAARELAGRGYGNDPIFGNIGNTSGQKNWQPPIPIDVVDGGRP